MKKKIDLNNIVHTRENNIYSETILNNNYKRLNNNCRILLDALERGERLTGLSIVKKYGMLEYRRRIKDLKESGIYIKERNLWLGCKEWFL